MGTHESPLNLSGLTLTVKMINLSQWFQTGPARRADLSLVITSRSTKFNIFNIILAFGRVVGLLCCLCKVAVGYSLTVQHETAPQDKSLCWKFTVLSTFGPLTHQLGTTDLSVSVYNSLTLHIDSLQLANTLLKVSYSFCFWCATLQDFMEPHLITPMKTFWGRHWRRRGNRLIQAIHLWMSRCFKT